MGTIAEQYTVLVFINIFNIFA